MMIDSVLAQIALSKASSDSSSDPVSQYVASLQKVCKPLTMFLITSCNFTEKELEKIFSEGESNSHLFLLLLLLFSAYTILQASLFTMWFLRHPFPL